MYVGLHTCSKRAPKIQGILTVLTSQPFVDTLPQLLSGFLDPHMAIADGTNMAKPTIMQTVMNTPSKIAKREVWWILLLLGLVFIYSGRFEK